MAKHCGACKAEGGAHFDFCLSTKAKLDQSFENGITLAVAWMINAHGEERMALEFLSCSGANPWLANEYDRKVIFKAAKNDTLYKNKWPKVKA